MFASPLDVDLGTVRVAWTPDLGLPVDAAVRDALAFVPGLLEELGCEVTETMPDLSGAGEIFQTLRAWHFEVASGRLYDRAPDRVKDTVRWNIEEARRRTLVDHATASARHAALVERVRAFFERFEVLALPTSQVVPFDVELDWPRTVEGLARDTYIDWMRTCSDITLTGCPAISMPAAFTADGLPVGVQFVGRPSDDLGLLRFARLWERTISPTRGTVIDS
jgi:amidase